MLNQNTLHQLAETISIGGLAASAVIMIATNTFFPHPQIATLSTLAGTGFAVSLKGTKRSDAIARLNADNQRLQKLAFQNEGLLRDAQNRLERGLKERQDYYESKLSELRSRVASDESLRTKYDEVKKAFDQRATELKEALNECARLRSDVAAFDGQKHQWIQKFDSLISEHNRETESLNAQINDLNLKVIRYESASDTIHETAKLRASAECRQIEDRLNALKDEYATTMQKYTEVANLYNQLRSEHIALSGEYASEFTELNEAVSQAIPTKFNEVLTERDRELMRLAGMVETLSKPRKFEAVGEFVRADKLIDLLWQSEHRIVLDAVEIVPNDERGNFKAFYWVRGNSGGQNTVDALNELTDSLAEQLFCIQPIKFDFDLQNPHRIGATFVYRKVKQTKETVSKLWKSADQFVTIAGKWSRVRITGGSEAGKSPLAEMIAASMQRVKPTVQIKLAFPKDGSEKNHWSIPVAYTGWKGCLDAVIDARKLMTARDEGSDKSKYFHAAIIDETDTALDKFSDLATEIKAVIKSGSHNNVGLILSGQNANVRQWKGFDRSDFENVVNVHIGSNAYHAIENSNLSDAEKKRVKEVTDKLTSYCESVNETIEDEDIKARFALVLEPGKKPYFIELPRFGSIWFDCLKASRVLSEIEVENVNAENESSVSKCQHLNSRVRKTFRDESGNPVRQYRKCKDCDSNFTVEL